MTDLPLVEDLKQREEKRKRHRKNLHHFWLHSGSALERLVSWQRQEVSKPQLLFDKFTGFKQHKVVVSALTNCFDLLFTQCSSMCDFFWTWLHFDHMHFPCFASCIFDAFAEVSGAVWVSQLNTRSGTRIRELSCFTCFQSQNVWILCKTMHNWTKVWNSKACERRNCVRFWNVLWNRQFV